MLGDERLSLTAALAANLFPLVGVFVLGWDVAALLVLYWIEIGTVIAWSAVAALFAELPSTPRSTRIPLDGLFEKRGGVRPWKRAPRVYPRNVPHAVGLAAILGAVWLASGYSLFVLQGDELLARPPDPTTVGTVLLGAVGSFVARGVSFRTDYLDGEEYREVSARLLAARPATYLLAVWALAAVTRLAVGPDAGVVALVTVVVAKFGYELVRYLTDNPASGLLARVLGASDETAATSVETPDGEPTARFASDARAVRFGGLALGLGYAVFVHGLFVAFPLWFLLRGMAGEGVAVGVAAAVVVGVAAGKGIEQYVQYGSMEYDLYNREVLGYDRCLGTPQWRVRYAEIESVSFARGLTGRLLGTGTVRLRTGNDRTFTLAHLPDAEGLSDELDARVR